MNIKNLRKSILQYAVEGKLVQQDIQDEPASILYDKIIKEKENLINQGQIKKEKPMPPVTDDEIPYDIPENWKWVRLGEVCEINPRNKLENNLEVSFIPMKLISDGYKNKHTHEIKIWKDIKDGFTHFKENDILLSKITPCFQNLKSCIAKNLVSKYGAGTTELHILRPIMVYNLYILYFLKTPDFIKNGIKNMTGTAGQQRVPINYISTYLFPLPPLREQKRIVQKVDELMALCDKLEQEEEKLLSLDKHFADTLPKSILQYTVEGKLVQQNIHDEPASLLYDKIIKEKEILLKQGKIKKEKPLSPITDDEIPYDIPNNWKWVRLGEVCEIKRGSGLTKNDFTNSGIPCIHYGQIHKYYKYSTNTTITYTSEQIGNKLKTVEYSDIIMAVTSENMNDVCKSIAWLGNYPIVTGGHTAIIKHSINPLYLIYLFNSNCFQIQKNKIAKGMKVIEVSSEKLKNIIFPLPPIKEQERIVQKVDELLTYCNKLKDII